MFSEPFWFLHDLLVTGFGGPLTISFGFQSDVLYGLYDHMIGFLESKDLLVYSPHLCSFMVQYRSYLVPVFVCGLVRSWGRSDPLSYISFIYFKFIIVVKILIACSTKFIDYMFICLGCTSQCALLKLLFTHRVNTFSLGGVGK